MTKPSPKYDQLRAMREDRHKGRKPVTAPIAKLRETVASIPVKRRPKVKPDGGA